MNILLVHNHYKTRFIGGEDLVFNREYEALVETFGQDKVFRYEVFNDKLSLLSLLKNIFFSREHKKEISRIIQENKIDLVHIHNFFPLLSTSIFHAAKESGSKVVQTLHNYRWWCISGILYRPEYGICELCVLKKNRLYGVKHGCYRDSILQSLVASLAFYNYKRLRSMEKIDCFFVLTAFQKEKLIEFGMPKEKIAVKPNFNNTSCNESIDFRNKQGFVFVGRLSEDKGIVDLITSWKNIDKPLSIIGDGPLRKFVQENTSDNIRFLGALNNDQVKKIIMESKYLIQLSKLYETFGLTLIEAFQMGTPVIGLAVGTRKDFIVDGVNGWLIQEMNQLQRVVEQADDFSGYEQLTKNATRTAREYSANIIVQLQISIYEKLLRGEASF